METTTIYEIPTDDLTLQPNKAASAVAFLEQWSTWLAQIIAVIKDFFDRLAAAFAE